MQSRPGGRRVVAQLIDGGNGLHLWSHAFETAADADVSTLVHALARAITRSLALQAGRPALTRAARRISADARAREAWQRGRYLMGRHTRSAYRDAAVLFDQALGADPAFALAWASRAQACIGQLGLSPAPDAAILADAHAAVARALELDPELAEAHAAAATLAFSHERDFVRAERASLEAIRYAPGRAYVHHSYAWMLMFAGRFAEAEQEFAVARELDPLDPMLRTHQALLSYYRRDFEGAGERFARVVDDEPTNLVARVLLASSRLGSGALDAALAAFEAIAAEVPGDSIGELGVLQAHALAGRDAAARAALAAMVARHGADRIGPYRMAIAHARLGDAVEAFAWLDRAAESRDMNLVCLAVDPSFDRLRDDPRWRPALARYRLPVIDPRVRPDRKSARLSCVAEAVSLPGRVGARRCAVIAGARRVLHVAECGPSHHCRRSSRASPTASRFPPPPAPGARPRCPADPRAAGLAHAPDQADRPAGAWGNRRPGFARRCGSAGARAGRGVHRRNKPGASGLIGVEAVKRAAPDGYTLLTASSNTRTMLPAPDGRAAVRSAPRLRARREFRLHHEDDCGAATRSRRRRWPSW